MFVKVQNGKMNFSCEILCRAGKAPSVFTHIHFLHSLGVANRNILLSSLDPY